MLVYNTQLERAYACILRIPVFYFRPRFRSCTTSAGLPDQNPFEIPRVTLGRSPFSGRLSFPVVKLES